MHTVWSGAALRELHTKGSLVRHCASMYTVSCGAVLCDLQARVSVVESCVSMHTVWYVAALRELHAKGSVVRNHVISDHAIKEGQLAAALAAPSSLL